MLTNLKQEKNDNNEVIKTYSNMAELADEELIKLLDNLIPSVIDKSEELYGKEYKDDLEKQYNNLKQNITKIRELLS